MVVLYLFVGLIAGFIAAVPPGAANIIVVKTTLEDSIKEALKISYGAGLGEVLLAVITLQFSMKFVSFFEMNSWIQITLSVLLFVAGSLFLFHKKIKNPFKSFSFKSINESKFLKGFLLAFINPPVLIYWLLALTIIHKYVLMVSVMSPWLTLTLFFTGVYLGKILTLYLYAKFGKKLIKKKNNKSQFYTYAGIALVIISVLQIVRLQLSSY